MITVDDIVVNTGTTTKLTPDDAPEFGNSRRKFIVAMLMTGAISPARMLAAVLDDIEQEAQR